MVKQHMLCLCDEPMLVLPAQGHPEYRNDHSAPDQRGPYPRLGIFTAADADREK